MPGRWNRPGRCGRRRPESLIAAVDEARIRQVLANLLGNVREHTPVTTPTAVRLAQVRGGVVLEVADAARAWPPTTPPGRSTGSTGAPSGMAGRPPVPRSATAQIMVPAALARPARTRRTGAGQAPRAGGAGSVLPSSRPSPRRTAARPPWNQPPATAPGSASGSRQPCPPRPPRPRGSHAPVIPRGTIPSSDTGRPAAQHPPSDLAGPPLRQPLLRPGRRPAPPPGSRYPVRPAAPSPPPRQPLPGPAGYPARPARQPPPRPAHHPAPMYAAPPATAWRPPPAGSARPGPPPATHRDDSMLPAPPGPPAPEPPAAHPGDRHPGPAELHHDWGDPPWPGPPPGPPRTSPRDARDGDDHPRGRPSHPGGGYPHRAATAASAGARNQVTTSGEAVRGPSSDPGSGDSPGRAVLTWGRPPGTPLAYAPVSPSPGRGPAPAGLGR